MDTKNRVRSHSIIALQIKFKIAIEPFVYKWMKYFTKNVGFASFGFIKLFFKTYLFTALKVSYHSFSIFWQNNYYKYSFLK
jgi:hypothetical protein